jgi:hypothetical protein
MESIKSFFESFKEFIWDIVGYILPGSYCIILMSLSVNSDYWLNVNYVFSSQYFPYVIVIISYLLGYAVYGLNIEIYKKREIKIFKKKFKITSYIDTIEDKIKKRISYKTTIQILHKRFQEKGIDFDSNNATLRDLRNIAMSFFPEQDQKIYTFSFRADIANHAGTISLFFGILGLLSAIVNCKMTFNVIIVDKTHIALYILLVISYFLFSSMRDRFYAISLSLPFSLLSTSEVNEKK